MRGARAREFVVGHPWTVLVCAVILATLALSRLVDLHTGRLALAIDTSIEALLPRSGAVLDGFEDMRARFGSDDVLLVAWVGDAVFTPARLVAWKRLTRQLERTPGVEHVDSLANAMRVVQDEEGSAVEPFLKHPPRDDEAAAALRAAAMANPLLAGQLVARDGRGLMLAVHFDPAADTDALNALVDKARLAAQAGAEGVEVVVSGPVVLRLEIGRLLLADLARVMPLAVVVTLIMAALGLRSLHGLVLPLAANGTSLVLTLAAFRSAGHALNFLTVILPPVVYVVGFASAIHVVADFDRERARGLDRAAAVHAALQETFWPLTLTAFTAGVGFSSLAISNIDSIRLFGVFATLGTVLGWLCALTIVPAGLMVLPLGAPRMSHGRGLARFAATLAAFDFRHRRAVVASGALLLALALVASTRIEVSTDYLGSFGSDNTVRRDFDRIGGVFAGAVPVEIELGSEIPQAFLDPALLGALVELKAWLLAQPEIRGVYTLSDYVALAHAASDPEQAALSPLPSTREATGQLLAVAPSEDVRRFATADFQHSVIRLQTTAASTADLLALGARIEKRLHTLPSYLQGQVTGSSYVIANTINDITAGQVQSLSLALGVIFIVLVVLFGSPRVAALALVTNALPIILYFGVLGIAGITLNLTTSLVADVVLGIAVDETIHFMSRFNEEARRAAHEREGMVRALAHVIEPATFTTAALCAGFLALTAGELQNQVQFGALSALILFLSWALNLTFTPAFCLRLRFVTLWEALTLDLGAAPNESIPLFHGLSARQARIVALLGRMERHVAGTRLLTIDDSNRSICVVIDGEMEATVPGVQGEVEHLRMLRRGDLVGEVALFEGRRSANVDTVSTVRVLWLSEEGLASIERRYPRIAAILYRNIGRVLAYRLVDRTVAR